MVEHENNKGQRWRRVGTVARFKPLHNGHCILLRTLCERADEVVIGIGSVNKYNARNPFTPEESEEMVKLALKGYKNYKIIKVPDFGHLPGYEDGKGWKEFVFENFGELDYFATTNDYVSELLKDKYKSLNSFDLISDRKLTMVKAAVIRLNMVTGGNWKKYIPGEVAKYIEENGLVERLKKEFGQEIIKQDGILKKESREQEKAHAKEI